MTDTQLYMAIGVPVVINLTAFLLVSCALNKRMDDLRINLNRRFDDLRTDLNRRIDDAVDAKFEAMMQALLAWLEKD